MEVQFRISKEYVRFIASFLKPLWAWGWLIVLTTVSFSFLTCYFSYVLKLVVDALELATRQTIRQVLFWPLMYYVLCYTVMSLVLRLRMLAASYFYPKLQKNVALEVHRILQSQVFGRFKDQMTGGLLNRAVEFNRTLSSILELLTIGLFSVVQVLVYMFFLYDSSGWFTLLYILWLAIFVPVTLWYSFRANHLARYYADSQSTLAGQMLDSINNMYFVKLFAQQNYESVRMEGASTTTYDHAVDFKSYLIKLRWMMDVFVLVIVILNLVLLVVLYEQGKVGAGDFIFVLTSVVEMTWYISDFCGERLPLLVEEYGKSLQAYHLFQFCKDQAERRGTNKMKVSKGEVCFDAIVYGYEEGGRLFDNFSLTIKPGEKVGLVGYSGSGKTTLMHLLTGFYTVGSGRIMIDQQSLDAVELASLRRHIAMIPQDTALFHRTLKENIRYGDLEASDEMVIAAAKKAHAHEFIIELPDRYDTMVGERGLRLSGGQRQRIAIARAFLKNAPILLLDEATSALDTATEQAIYDSLQALMRGRTVIVIAHRLATIKSLDRIIVMDKGAIVEQGTHSELLAKNGHYARMWSHQSDADILS